MRLTPLVRRLAEEYQIGAEELASIPGTGEGGRITKEDLLRYIGIRGLLPRPLSSPPTEMVAAGRRATLENRPPYHRNMTPAEKQAFNEWAEIFHAEEKEESRKRMERLSKTWAWKAATVVGVGLLIAFALFIAWAIWSSIETSIRVDQRNGDYTECVDNAGDKGLNADACDVLHQHWPFPKYY